MNAKSIKRRIQKPLSILLAMLTVMTVIIITNVQVLAVNVIVNDEVVGTVDLPKGASNRTEQQEKVLSNVKSVVSKKITTTEDTTKADIKKEVQKSTYTQRVVVNKSEITSYSDVADNLIEASDKFVTGYGLSINGQIIASNEQKSVIEDAIKQAEREIKNKYHCDDTFQSKLVYKFVSGEFLVSDFSWKEEISEKYYELLLNNFTYSTTTVKTSKIKFENKTKIDYSKAKGYKKVVQKGKSGEIKKYYKNDFANGDLVKTTLIKTTKTEPIDNITVIGGKETDCAVFKQESLLAFPLGKQEYYISSEFGKRGSGFHHGIDLACKEGSNIYAADSGVVVYAASEKDGSAYGNRILIRHKNGIETLYAHLSEFAVKKGDKVSQGEFIGLSGNTGNSTGPHLHFEYRVNGKAVNPKEIIGLKGEVCKE